MRKENSAAEVVMESLCKKVSVWVSVVLLSAIVCATPKSWIATSYRPDIWSTGSWFRAPVTDGYMDLLLAIENVSFTNAEFSIRYDSAIINPVSSARLLEIRSGLSLVSVTNEDLQGTWKKATIVLSGSITIDQAPSESDAVFRLRLIPIAEGTVPITLWPGQWSPYPDNYNTCTLTLMDNDQQVLHERKEFNDGTQLITFTDKTNASVLYHFDLNFGNPINGFLQVVYENESVEEFHTSNHDKGITIDPANGAYFISPQPNAVSHTLIFPGYEQWPLSLSGGWSVSHTQPSVMLSVLEAEEGFHGIKAAPEDITLTIQSLGIGENFDSSLFSAAIAGDKSGILNKEFTFAYVDNDTIRLTIIDGLEPDYYTGLYIFKDSTIFGRAWFSASEYFPVTFTVKDENDNPIENAVVSIPLWGMNGLSSIKQKTDQNGQAVLEMPGNPDWGHYQEYRIIYAGYSSIVDALTVYDQAVEVSVVMTPSPSVNITDFTQFASWWQSQECAWYDNCYGADKDFNGTVNLEDFVIFISDWLKDM
jgi:hypothetical protein